MWNHIICRNKLSDSSKLLNARVLSRLWQKNQGVLYGQQKATSLMRINLFIVNQEYLVAVTSRGESHERK